MATVINKIKLCSLLSTISLLTLPIISQAEQIAPNPNPVDSTITINADIDNLIGFSNHGVISINTLGTLNNSITASLTNGTRENTLGSLNNSGNLNNTGGLSNFGSLINFENVSNSGVLGNGIGDNTDAGHAGYLANSGTLTNQVGGTLNNFGNLSNLVGGTLNNSGSLNNGTSSDHAGYLGNSGTLNNQAGGTVTTFGNLTNLVDGTFNNAGTLNNGTTNDHAGYLGNAGNLTNVAGAILNSFGLFDNSGLLENSGTLGNTGTLIGTGTYIQTAGQTLNSGSLSQSAINIKGGDLIGTGTITAPTLTLASQASLNMGNSLGSLTLNGDFHSSGNLVFKIGGLSDYDIFNINGNAFFTGGTIEFNLINGFKASAGDYWDFMLARTIGGWNAPSFAFNGLDQGLGWTITQTSEGERLFISTLTPITEPETYVMFLSGLGLMSLMLSRRKGKFSAWK